ncbi:hypothetical protein Xen7305DRAFT_00021970 [Xenococcus sp. PCC 7305]|uniref:thiol-disulfide oxidoreductase DCC family protein n=1 Tax=Xenococcus sp. PCC 7305 TaxID=102125 RepID=UPI0002ABAF37|nr:DUF393 domain-containing protein [Xenococcus sp. PCC 7305]ELS02483.1 hypothetical protein Xen7305DRAFT_00021970 [Xenococcus sp. PCC 7305]
MAIANTIPTQWKIKLLYDGECPLCVREVKFLKKRDAGRGIVNFVDIADPDYNPQDHGGIDYELAMDRIHGILCDGTIIKNVEVFRRVYEELGMGWVYAVTKIPAIATIANFIYGLWAKYRLPLTRRPSLVEILATRSRQDTVECSTDKCQTQ